jgi:hypothetical protein
MDSSGNERVGSRDTGAGAASFLMGIVPDVKESFWRTGKPAMAGEVELLF